MNESVLRDFFLGRVQPAALAADIRGSIKLLTAVEAAVEIEDMHDEFAITCPMLVSLCDAVLSGYFPADGLRVIGFALVASDAFAWEDDLISEVVNHWSCPEINYPLTPENIERFRNWLSGAEPYPARPRPGERQKEGRLVSVTRKVAVLGQRSQKRN